MKESSFTGENFFYYNHFCIDIGDLANLLEIDEESVHSLPDNFYVNVEVGELKPAFSLDSDNLFYILLAHYPGGVSTDKGVAEKIKKALISSIDFKKLADEMPEVFYPSGKYEKFTKGDFIGSL